MGFLKNLFGGGGDDGDSNKPQRKQAQPQGDVPGDLQGLMTYYQHLLVNGEYETLVPQLDALFGEDRDKLNRLIADQVFLQMDQNPQMAQQPMGQLGVSMNAFQAAILTGATLYARLGAGYFSKRKEIKASIACNKKAIRLVQQVPGHEDGVGNHVLVIAFMSLARTTNDPEMKCKLLRKVISLNVQHNAPHVMEETTLIQTVAHQQIEENGC